jgi:hypothetical protein
MCRLTPATSDSAKNAFGQEVFRHKGGNALVESLPVTSAAGISSQALETAGVAASEAKKISTGGAQQVEGLQSDLCMAGLPPVQEQQAGGASRPRDEEEDDRCLYVGTPWEDDVIADRRDIDEFKAVHQTIARTLLISSQHRPYCFSAYASTIPRS